VGPRVTDYVRGGRGMARLDPLVVDLPPAVVVVGITEVWRISSRRLVETSSVGGGVLGHWCIHGRWGWYDIVCETC